MLGDDGSSIEIAGLRIAPAYLSRIYGLLIEIPEGSWGWNRGTVAVLEIGHAVGSDLNPERCSELRVNTAKYAAARPS